jgi:hypothetical protein
VIGGLGEKITIPQKTKKKTIKQVFLITALSWVSLPLPVVRSGVDGVAVEELERALVGNELGHP